MEGSCSGWEGEWRGVEVAIVIGLFLSSDWPNPLLSVDTVFSRIQSQGGRFTAND